MSDANPVDFSSLRLADRAENLERIAWGARIALLPAALLTIIAAFVNRPLPGTLLEAGTVIGAVGVAALAVTSLTRPRPGLDLGAALLAMLLAGGQAVQAFGLLGYYGSGIYVLPLFAWLTLLASGCALIAPLWPMLIASSSGAARHPSSTESASASHAAAPGDIRRDHRVETAGAATAGRESQVPGAGWYPEPGGRTVRWWDGSRWTEHRRSLDGVQSPDMEAAG